MDKFIVRITIFYTTLYFMYVLYYAWSGVNVFDDTYKLLLVYSLFVFVKEHPKYHCRFARFLALNIFATESITYIDNKYCIFEDAELMLIVLSSMWIISVTATLVLAFRHLYKVQKLKSDKNKLYEDRRRNDDKD